REALDTVTLEPQLGADRVHLLSFEDTASRKDLTDLRGFDGRGARENVAKSSKQPREVFQASSSEIEA
ncbi:MAG: hypothetical protein ACRDGN_15885, partial [bacterium]